MLQPPAAQTPAAQTPAAQTPASQLQSTQVQEPFWPNTLKDWAPISGIGLAVATGLWTVWVYYRNSRVKAAELLHTLEKEYTSHLDTFSILDNKADYDEKLKASLQKQIVIPPVKLEPDELEYMQKLDAAIRFLFLSLTIKRLKLDWGYIERLNAYYLRKLRKYEDLSKYVEMYWPQVFFWSQLAGRPLPKKCVIYICQLKPRLRAWWHGSDSFDKRLLLVPPAVPSTQETERRSSSAITSGKSR